MSLSTLTVPASLPDVSDDVEQLHKAFSGWGTNEDLIISILAHRNATQRKMIREVYSSIHGGDLLQALDKELTSNFERIVHLFTLDPPERDAYLANEATKKFTSSNWVLMEVSASRSSDDLLAARRAYHAKFKKSLEEDVAHHTTGDFRKLLVPLVSSYRYEGPEINAHLAKSEAKILHEKISDKAFADDELIRIIATRSKAQLSATLNHYNNDFGHAITKDLKEDVKDDYQKLLRATIKCLTTPEKYFEKLLRLAINKMGTDEGALTRVVATRVEVDMKRIKEEYYRRNTVHLDRAIAKDTHGDYEKMLIELLLVPLVSSYRYEGPEINAHLAKSEAKILHEKISDKAFADDELIRIIATRSKAQLSATLNHYNNDFGHAITKDLKEDVKDDYQKLLRATIKCLTTPEKYFEKLLRLAINKMGTDEGALTRVVATRVEVDMKRIKEEYYRRNTVHLDRAIAKDTHGDYEKMLIELVGTENA